MIKSGMKDFFKLIYLINCKFFIPIWYECDVNSFKQIITANFLYPKSSKSKYKKLFGVIFYYSFSIHMICFASHGYFFNFQYKNWKLLAKLFAFHPNLPLISEIFKYICALASSEILYFRFHFLYYNWKRKIQLNMLLSFDNNFDEKIKVNIFKLTKFMCFNLSYMTIALAIFFFIFGWNETDLIGKSISIFHATATIYSISFASTDLFLLYSYSSLIGYTVIQSASQMYKILDQNKQKSIDDDQLVTNLMQKYYLCVNMINQSNSFISTLSVAGKNISVPMMSLTWLLLFENSKTPFLIFFKWLAMVLVGMYASRVYFLNFYLSIIHSKSKKIYSKLNSLIARAKIGSGFNKNHTNRRTVLFIIEGLSGRMNQMAYRDKYDGIVEQKDVLNSISITLEFLLLLLTFTQNK